MCSLGDGELSRFGRDPAHDSLELSRTQRRDEVRGNQSAVSLLGEATRHENIGTTFESFPSNPAEAFGGEVRSGN